MKRITLLIGLTILALTLAACGGNPAPTAVPVIEEEPTEVPAEPTDAPEPEPTDEPEPTVAPEPTDPPAEPTPEPEPEPAAYEGPITEIAIRRVSDSLTLTEFTDNREAYIDILQGEDGVVADREFRAFLDFSTFGPPAPAVYIGMTEYASAEAFQAASGSAGSTEAAGQFFSSFDLEIFGALRPVNPDDRYELAALGTEPGQVIEVAARDLSTYEGFDSTDYEQKRDTFLEALAAQPGFVQEYQWVSILDENIVVGMTVYESVDAYVAINSSSFVETPEYTEFVFNYPFVAGYANFDAKPAGVTSAAMENTVQFPESVAVNGDTAYVSNFFDGSIHTVDLATGNTGELVAAGTEGIAAGWGLWYESESDLLLACAARNPFAGPFDNINAAMAIDPADGTIVEIWDLPAGALCNSIVSIDGGDIYISDVSPNADVIRIDRTTGESSVWVDEPAWENDTGFGLGGLIYDGAGSIYVSAGGPLLRIPINEDNTAGTPVNQTLLDANGNPLPGLGFDGFARSAESGLLYGAAFDFNSFQSRVASVTILDEETVQIGTALGGVLGITGIDADNGRVIAVDGQIIQALFVEGYAPPAPFPIIVVTE